jgi:hypothetical protein
MNPTYATALVMRPARRKMPLGKLLRGTFALVRMVFVMLLMLLALSVLSLVRKVRR